MSEPDVYTILADDVVGTAEEVFGPRPVRRSPSGPIATPTRTGRRTTSHFGMTNRKPGRVPAASSMSLLLCGAGQVFNGQVKLGLLLFLAEALFVIGHRAMIAGWSSLLVMAETAGIGEGGLILAVAAFDFLMVIFLPAVVFQAYRRAESEHGGYDGTRIAVLPGLASLLVPGWGQMLNAQIGKAVFFLFCALSAVWAAVFLLFTPVLPAVAASLGEQASERIVGGGIAVLIAAAVMWVLSIYDAVLVSGFLRVIRSD